ncbi:hypothetical protein TVAG_105640 [Trichomonas vaginalis G3]|uniref:Uncharacterized protein n=1 Tax=Trichomonas vaginalis (strain ATCC PRA-98 / G3) TaxID=412133 RepID=A2FLQ3_TRIV3|nr:hypothetical protein TVAGG3_0515460 [Trichomonas vaginalis G3]EAX94145.1 hypothetical protein TVAG_105640 [Trichomonas vaginalis G3]KAI5518088.1 hypothetical protein TVAGG3_0515460 [Trichomonas vaginalis G3]|eukprot:XP_001307075.1 hypothetical protein [Trichomonas vaginalis G3]
MKFLIFFSRHHNPGCIDNYNIKIIEKNPYKTRSYEYGFHIAGITSELPYILEHLDQIRANDRMFYSFNEVNLQYECYNAYSLLSTDPNNKNNETLRTYKIKSELANPPYGMMFLNAWNSITSFFRSNIDRPLPIQDQSLEIGQTIPKKEIPLESEQPQSKKVNPKQGKYIKIEQDAQPHEPFLIC